MYKQIVERYFPPNSPIKIKKHLEGQSLNEHNNFVIGCRAGPEIDPSNLLHEMCHFAEREIPKLLEKPSNAWGFTFGKFWQIGSHWGHEPQTDQSVKREARVWAFQYNLLQSLGNNETIKELVASAVYLPAFVNYKSNKCRIDDYGDYKQRELDALKFLEDEVFELSQKYTLEKFESNWFERIELLRKL